MDAPYLVRMTTVATAVDSLNLLGHYNDALTAARTASADAADTPFEVRCELAMAAAEHTYGRERAGNGRHTEAETALASCVDRLVGLHSRQFPLAPAVEQLLTSAGATLDQVLRAQGKNDNADAVADTIAAVVGD
jgi:hypothetical protein